MNGVRIPDTTGAVCVRSVRGSDLLGEQPPLRETVRRQDGTVEALASVARVRRLTRGGWNSGRKPPLLPGSLVQ